MSSVVTNSLIANTVTTNSLTTNSLSGNAIMVSGSVAGVSFVGNGAGLSYLNLANVYGTLAVGSGGTGVTTSTGTGNIVFSVSPTFQGTVTLTGNLNASNISGNADGVSSIPAGNLAGTIANARLPSVISVANVTANGSGLSSISLANVYGTLAVGSGGSGVTTSTGSGNLVLNVSPTFQGTVTLAGTSTLQQMTEVLTAKTGATGVVTHDFTTGTLFHHSSIAANFTCNLTNVPTTDSRSVVTALILNQGATPYMCNAFQIDGAAQTLKWQGGSAPSGTASKIDVLTFSLIRTGAAWYVLGQNANFG